MTNDDSEARDIPLAQVQLLWGYRGDKKGAPQVLAIALGTRDDSDYTWSWGASSPEFQKAGGAGKINLLYRKCTELEIDYDIRAAAIEKACSVIPEWREITAYTRSAGEVPMPRWFAES